MRKKLDILWSPRIILEKIEACKPNELPNFPASGLSIFYFAFQNAEMYNNPIVVVDDGEDDLHLVEEAIKQLQLSNEIKLFKSGDELLNYLDHVSAPPFLIISDVNLVPGTGLHLRSKLLESICQIYEYAFSFLVN
jgi:hypothetical protein